MPKPLTTSFTFLAAVGLSMSVSASAAAEDAKSDSPPPIFRSAPATPARKLAAPVKAAPAPRVISPEIAAALASDIPKYQPPAPAGQSPAQAATHPKNQIPRLPATRLPTYTVRESKYRGLSDREVSSDQVFTDMEVKHYLTEFDYGFLNRFTIPLFGVASKESRAMEAYERDEWKDAFGELKGFTKLESTEPSAGK